MTRKQTTNFLLEKHQQIFSLSKVFREKICEECNWSEATYYRKAKKNANSISKAEKEKIIAIANDLLHEALMEK
ncbi:hypothetical protein [Chitinophaga cymbidii]|uniref:Uncharacterized protein n=1 Tax=Chitinophaga cymbidii TaxID=1096750 RepID=A0A512RFP1_9BACT|nr:hypothetical protein [Chitinophaga cymbidii]GEP94526.1 hypothetical protein CCY01nite_07860 [Chitinophaga cymbidii]